MRIHSLLILCWFLLSAGISSVTAQKKPLQSTCLIKGIDHIPIVVHDTDSAAAVYKRFGFAIKPGRKHPNSIWNQHIKFPDGTELELITATKATDELSTEYFNWLKTGEGPLYFGLYAPDIPALEKQTNGTMEDNSITYPANNIFHPLFFGTRNLSPTDKPEHFAHPNTATSLVGVWLATDSIPAYVDLFKHLSVPIKVRKLSTPFTNISIQAATFEKGEVILLPAYYRALPGHLVIGATVSVTDITKVQTQLIKGGFGKPAIITGKGGSFSIFLPPAITHGIWLEFRQQ